MAAYKTVEDRMFGAHAADAQDFSAALLALLRVSEALDGSPPSGNPYTGVITRWRALGVGEHFLKEAATRLQELASKYDKGQL